MITERGIGVSAEAHDDVEHGAGSEARGHHPPRLGDARVAPHLAVEPGDPVRGDVDHDRERQEPAVRVDDLGPISRGLPLNRRTRTSE